MIHAVRSMMVAAVLVTGIAAPATLGAEDRTSSNPLTVLGTVRGATPNAPSQGSFSMSLDGLPDQVAPGGTLSGTFTIDYKSSTAGEKRNASVSISIETPLGEAVVRQSTIRVVSGRSRTVRFSLPIDDRAQAGFYTIVVATTIDGETLRVGHQVEVTGKR